MNTLEHDKLGFCAFCHVDIAEYPEVNGVKHLKWKPTRRECLFKLSNESVLHVSLCAECDENLDRRQFMGLMDSIVAGWEEELKVSKMSDEQKTEYRTSHYRLNIVERI
jgi:hypothetical protein